MRELKMAKAGKGLKACSLTLRPTLSKVREALFNIIAASIGEAVFVDLYAGTGAVGFEAMSRGATAVYFVESDRKRAARIKELLHGCRCMPKAHVVAQKASAFIKRAQKEGTLKADIIFLDPPYLSDELDRILPLIAEAGRGVLAPEALVVAEHATRKKTLAGTIGELKKKKSYRYGDTTLTVYELAGEEKAGEEKGEDEKD